MLIHVPRLLELERPWFKFIDEHGAIISEDAYFCRKVRGAGMKILADGGIVCPHWDAKTGFHVLDADSYPMLDAKKVEDPRVEVVA